MSKSSRIAALVMGLLLVLGVGSFLSYLGYCKYKTTSNEYHKYYEQGIWYDSINKHRDGAQLFDQFKNPCIACIVMGLGLIALAIFRKSPVSSPQNSIPIDPLAD